MLGVATGSPHLAHFVIKRLPIAPQDMLARDDDVDFLRASFDGLVNLFNALGERAQAGREAGRDSRDRYAAAFERRQRVLDPLMIDADRADLEIELAGIQRVDDILAQGLPGFGAQPRNLARRVIASQGGQVDHGDGSQQPSRLPGFLDAAPRRERGCPPLGGAQVDLCSAHPAHIQRDARISFLLRHCAPIPRPLAPSRREGEFRLLSF